MTEQEFRTKYVGKAVLCDTEGKARNVLALAQSFGWKWGSGKSLIEETYWRLHQEKNCYLFDFDKTTGYSGLDFYEAQGYEIVEFESDEKKVKKTKKVFDLGVFIAYMQNQKRSNEDIKNTIRDWALDCHGLTEKEMSKINKWTDETWMKEVEVEVELTAQEIEVLKALKVLGLNWIARDKNDELCAYKSKPTKNSFEYDAPDRVYCLNKDLFLFITWQDKEPTSIDDLLKESECLR